MRIDPEWLAGFFDAAGSIYVTSAVNTYKGRAKRYWRVGVSMTVPAGPAAAVLDAVVESYGGRVYVDPASATGASLRWMAQAQADVHGFLFALGPHLRIKADQAEEAVARIEAAGRRGASLAAGVGRRA